MAEKDDVVTPEQLAEFARQPENQGIWVQHAIGILLLHLARPRNLYDVAREVTDEVLGDGTYAELNRATPTRMSREPSSVAEYLSPGR